MQCSREEEGESGVGKETRSHSIDTGVVRVRAGALAGLTSLAPTPSLNRPVRQTSDSKKQKATNGAT